MRLARSSRSRPPSHHAPKKPNASMKPTRLSSTLHSANEISVHSDYQRRGIARRLIERITDLAIDRGCEGLWVMADAENGTARSVYKALGGQESGRAVMFDWPL